jgi:hypothetical protein
MPRGGRRPGAGAPRGNLNHLVDGRRSRQLRQLFIAAARSPWTIAKVLNAAVLYRAGLVKRQRRRGSPDQAGHQKQEEK